MKHRTRALASAVLCLVVLSGCGADGSSTPLRASKTSTKTARKRRSSTATAAATTVAVPLSTDVASETTVTEDTTPTTEETTGTSDTSAPETTVADETTTVPSGPASAVDGKWAISDGSEVGYRVEEDINGFKTEANGRTTSISGTFEIAGGTLTTGEFSVEVATLTSDQLRRDNQLRGRIMEVDKYPTADFKLTAPVKLGEIPAEGEQATVSVTGDLTIKGVTNPVTFDVTGTLKGGRIGLLGKIPFDFKDYNIPDPGIGTIRVVQNGLLEFILVLGKS